MFGDLPPSSSQTRLRFERAEYSSSRRPVAPDPVKVSTSTSWLSASACPVTCPGPVTTFNTPGGSPASSASSASRSSDKDAVSAGLSTTELPAAKAGASFQAPIISGKFHGTMAPTTPTGSRWISASTFAAVGAISP